MGESSEKDVPAWLESCKTNNITLFYRRHHWRSKKETWNRNEQEDETCIEKGVANVSVDEQVTTVGHREDSKSTTPKIGLDFEIWDVPAPGTPDIFSRKHGKRMDTNECSDSKKRTCFRSLYLVTGDLKREARNILMFDEETDDDSQVEEHDPKMTEKDCDAKDSGRPWTLLVYRRRKQDNYQVDEERDWQKSEEESFDRQINLFMTRMRDIQGERKFSEWKGSVMDSIVGAYLAQNVNDALSSSAFMSLSAKFPREAVGVSSPVEACSSKMRNNSVVLNVKEKKDIASCRRSVQKGKLGKNDRCLRTRNSTRQRIKTKHDPILLNVLKDCYSKYHSEKKMLETSEAINWDLVRMAKVDNISEAIQIRGMNNNLAERIKDCLEHLVKNFGSTDMEWIRDVPPHKAKEYLLSIYGLGLKSVECIRLLTLRQKAFPIDRNAGRVVVRLGWVTLNQLREGEEFDLLKEYPKKLNSIQMCLWPLLSHLEWFIQYELHCQLITFGKAFCTERNPNCYECPMRAECRHFASVQERAEVGLTEMDVEDYDLVRPRTRFHTSKRASIPVVKKKKNVTSLRTEHQVYVLPKGHDLLAELESIEHDDPCPYLLAEWTPESLEKDECIPEEDAVYGTLLIPARTATGGTFPLNGTFFQANEVFADDESSEVPIKVPRASLTNLSSTTLYCGNSMSSICKGMTCVEVQKCFKSGFACLRGLNLKTREPKPLPARFHNRASKAGKTKKRDNTK